VILNKYGFSEREQDILEAMAYLFFKEKNLTLRTLSTESNVSLSSVYRFKSRYLQSANSNIIKSNAS